MAISRYTSIGRINLSNKTTIASSVVSVKLYKAIQSGDLQYQTYVLADGERLDVIAQRYYGDSSYWWVIAACSGIGWPLQLPAGTLLRIPQNIGSAIGFIT